MRTRKDPAPRGPILLDPLRLAPPGGAQNAGDGGLQPLVGVGDHQLDAAQAPARQLAKEFRPAGLGLGAADIQPEDLPATVGVDADGQRHGDRDDPPALAHLPVGGVQPDIRPVVLQRAGQEGLDLSSISPHSRDTWLLEIPPMAWTGSSTERVDTPWT